MALTSIEPVGGAYPTPPLIPREVAKASGFNFLPPGTLRLYDAKKWALYYNALHDVSIIVMDAGRKWSIRPVPGRMGINMASGVMATKPCCQED